MSVNEVGLYAYLTLLASLFMIPLNSGAGIIINSYYFTSGIKHRKELFFHTYSIELSLKIFSFFFLLLFSEFFMELVVNDPTDTIIEIFRLIALAMIFSSIKPLLFQILTIEKKAKDFFIVSIIDVFITVVLTVFFLHVLHYGIKGYVLSVLTASILMFFFNFYIMKKNISIHFKFRWLKIIYNKGIKHFAANLMENFYNIFDTYLVQKYLGMYQVGLYTHAKQYITKFSALDKSIIQAYQVEYMLMLKKSNHFNNIKTSALWLSFVFLIGIGVLFFSETIIALLTHNKFTESAYIVKFLYIVAFLRFNQVQYNQQLFFFKKPSVFVNISFIVNFLTIIMLIASVLLIERKIEYILFIIVANAFLKNILMKLYAIKNYRIFDKSEIVFWIYFVSYLLIWRVL